MGNPFQDQLLKAGLVSKKQASKAKHQKHLNRKQKKEDSSAEISNKVKKNRQPRQHVVVNSIVNMRKRSSNANRKLR